MAMFLILGLLVVPSYLVANAPIAIGIAVALIFIASPLAVIVSLLPFSFPWREQVFISWVGLKRGCAYYPGFVSMVKWRAEPGAVL